MHACKLVLLRLPLQYLPTQLCDGYLVAVLSLQPIILIMTSLQPAAAMAVSYSCVLAETPVQMPPSAQQHAAPCASMQHPVADLLDSNRESLDCMGQSLCSGSDNESTPHAVKQELPDQALHRYVRVTKIPGQCLEDANSRKFKTLLVCIPPTYLFDVLKYKQDN